MTLMSNSSVTKNPVVLIHGIDDTDRIFHRMKPYLQQQGWTVHSTSLTPSDGRVGLDRLAQQLQTFVAQTVAPGQPFDLVGFSMGGIISRYYVQRLNGSAQVQRFVTISSPHNGTYTAYLRRNTGGEQMRPNSTFLQDLNQSVDQLNQVQFTSFWTPLDLMIVPASSSQLPVGQEIQIPVIFHPWMVKDARVMGAIAQILSQPLSQPRSQPIQPINEPQPDRQSHHAPSRQKLPLHGDKT